MPHMKSLTPTIQQGALYTYLTISLNPYSLIPNIVLTANVLNSSKSCAYIYQHTTNCNFYFICCCQYVPQTNMPTKLGIYAIYAPYLICISKECTCIYVPHINHVH